MIIAVVLAGAAGGLVGAAYLAALEVVGRLLGPDRWAPGAHLVVLAMAGGVVAVAGRWWGERVTMELLVDHIHVRGGPEGVRGLRTLVPTSLVCIGVGGALGPEAPLVTTTGTLASWIGGRSGFGRDQLRVVSIAGMAAGFTVLFGAPLGSAVFALEILHRRSLRYEEAVVPAVTGALCGYAVHVAASGIGLRPVFAFPPAGPFQLVDLAWGLAAGVVGAGLALAFRLLCRGLERLAVRVPGGGRPVVGGAMLGLIALASPYALTNGEVQIEHLTTVRTGAAVLLGAAAVKLVASAVTLVAGWEGGFIIPLFFVGFCVARAAGDLVPGLDPWVAAAALMAAANAGVTRTPIGSTLVVTGMAGMALVPSTLAAAVVSSALTARSA